MDDYAAIRDGLRRLRDAPDPPNRFGVNIQHYRLNPPLSEGLVESFEAEHGIALPADYRRFLIKVGDGGVGPDYGVFPLGQVGTGFGTVSWEPGRHIGTLSEPFPHTDEWNDRYSEEKFDGEDQISYQARMDALDEGCFGPSQVNGSIPLCFRGCGYFLRLVVTSPEAGNVWSDGREENLGLSPLPRRDSPRTTFLQWYQDWLDDALAKLR